MKIHAVSRSTTTRYMEFDRSPIYVVPDLDLSVTNRIVAVGDGCDIRQCAVSGGACLYIGSSIDDG